MSTKSPPGAQPYGSDDTVRLALVGQVLRRRWWLLVVLVVLGAAVGAGASVLLSPGYKTTSDVLLQGPRQADELLTQAEVATSSVVLDRASAALAWHPSGLDLKKQVTAAVSTGNVVEITVAADTATHAQQLADQVAKDYVKYAVQLMTNSGDSTVQLAQEQRESLRQQVTLTNQKISDLSQSVQQQNATVESVQARTQLEALRTALEQAMNNLNQADAATSTGNIVVLGPAEKPTGQAAPTLVQLVAGGALLFFLIGVFGHLFAARADRRLRGEPDITAALGAPVLAGIDAPAADPAGTRRRGVLGLLRRLVGGDKPWVLPPVASSADEHNREIRYRRVLARLAAGPARVDLLVPADDGTATAAADRLAELAGETGTPMRRFDVDPDRPTVPDSHGDSGVLVVLSAGTRTAWQLVGIAEACADAGQELVGAVLTHPVREPGTAAKAPKQPKSETAPEMAGTA